jgi:hypothetical protein
MTAVLNLYESVYDDGNMGSHHTTVSEIYLWIASMYCDVYDYADEADGDKNGYLDAAFGCLDKALEHTKKFDGLINTGEHKYTAYLVDHVTHDTNGWAAPFSVKNIKDYWVFFDKTKEILKKDERWQIWVAKTAL